MQAATASDAPILLRTSAGTGHGVGSYLSVHEGPARISKLGNTVPDALELQRRLLLAAFAEQLGQQRRVERQRGRTPLGQR